MSVPEQQQKVETGIDSAKKAPEVKAELNRPGETEVAASLRMNQAARDEGEKTVKDALAKPKPLV